jgi:ceramide glucosyltransferase
VTPTAGVLALLLAGSLVYCALAVFAARDYARQKSPPLAGDPPPLSLLKPLSGAEPGLESNLRAFFEQRYPEFEILFAVRTPEDPAVEIVRKLQTAYPRVPCQLLFTGEPPSPNAKVFSLAKMTAQARYGFLAMTDSDVGTGPGMLSALAAEFDAGADLITCPYRAAPGPSVWSTLEALIINTEQIPAALAARKVEGMKFALGPAIAIRRETLDAIGGFESLKDFLAEDFVMGNRAAALGRKVVFSSWIIDHHIGGENAAEVIRHLIRWTRSTRRSRPAGYVGQVFTNPLPLAFLLWIAQPAWWPAVTLAAILRGLVVYAAAIGVLRDPLARRLWWLTPVADCLSFGFWIAGFFGTTIWWRGRAYRLLRDGRFELR